MNTYDEIRTFKHPVLGAIRTALIDSNEWGVNIVDVCEGFGITEMDDVIDDLAKQSKLKLGPDFARLNQKEDMSCLYTNIMGIDYIYQSLFGSISHDKFNYNIKFFKDWMIITLVRLNGQDTLVKSPDLVDYGERIIHPFWKQSENKIIRKTPEDAERS